MNKTAIGKKLSEFNSIMKESDDIYRCAAKALGLPDCAFWILYTLRAETEAVTQHGICSTIYQPKQTVNSALKKLEQDNILRLTEMTDRRSKQVLLTARGLSLASRTVDLVIDAEKSALSGLTASEQETFLALFHKYTNLLKENMPALQEKACRPENEEGEKL